jgi:T5SS/PEP-CTERM-associated repeat protein
MERGRDSSIDGTWRSGAIRRGALAFAALLACGLFDAGAEACGFPPDVLPPGSYRFSCDGFSVAGTILTCSENESGEFTSLDIGNCASEPALSNGVLVCDPCSATGACCVEGKGCSQKSSAQCQGVGRYGGDGSTCDQLDCGECEVTWVGSRGGAFADAENWEPPRVPSFEIGGQCDTVLVQGGGAVEIDLDAPAPALSAAGVAPAPIRNVGRLDVSQCQSLRPVDGTIKVDALSPVVGERSLELRNGATLLLDAGAVLARHVAVGALGEGAIEVIGAGGLLETEGRLGLGVQGSGNLLVADGATVIAAEAVLGEESAQGSLTVEGAASLLETGSIAVGLEDDGNLRVEAGGQVSSEAGVIGFNLEGDERGAATVTGKDPAGNPSKWTLSSLDVRPRGMLLVANGAQVEVTGALSIGAEGAGTDCLEGRACVFIHDGQLVVANGVTVGDGGEGTLRVLPKGELAASGVFTIRDGKVLLLGPRVGASLITDLRVATGAEETGSLEVRGAGLLDLFGRFVLGGATDSLGALLILGDRADPDATRVIAIDTSGQDSVVGGATPLPPDRTAELLLESAVLGLAGTGHDLVIERNGFVSGRGGRIVFDPGGKLVNRGALVGDFVIEGDYEQAPGAVLNASLLVVPAVASATRGLALAAAAPPPPPFQPLVVTGDADLAGTAKLQFGNGVAPQQGDQVELLQVEGDVTGAFDTIEIAGLAPGFDFASAIVNGTLVLTSLTDTQPLPFVSLAGKPTLVETKKGAKVKLTRGGDTSAPLTVAYTLAGTAENGVDYAALPGEIQFPARKKSVTLLVQPIADELAEGSETIEIELAPNASFAPGLASELRIELLDGKQK